MGASGGNGDGQCNIPPLPDGVTYTQAAAGNEHTVLLRSDGTAVASGFNVYGQCNIPPLPDGVCYIKAAPSVNRTVLSLHLGSDQAAFYLLNGAEVCKIEVVATDNMVDIRKRFMERMKVSHGRFHVMLSTGESLNAVCSQHPSVSVGHFAPRKRRKKDE